MDTTDPRADYPPSQRFVNQGPDPRIPGALGAQLALIQRLHSFKSETPPARTVEHLPGGGLHELAVAPNGKEHHTYAFPAGDRWSTFRFGYRYDANWGDEHVKGYNPQPEIVGGYIYDVVIKLMAREPFIEVP